MSEHKPPANPGYELSDVSTPPIWRFIFYLVAFMWVSIGLMWVMFEGLKSYDASQDAPPTPMEAERVLPSSPRLQVNLLRDQTDFRAAQEELLNSYGWEDKTVKVVRIPVSRAMELVAERGLPDFKVKEQKSQEQKK